MNRKGISTARAAIMVLIVVVAAFGAGIYLGQMVAPPTTATTTTIATGPVTTTGVGFPEPLVIVDYTFPDHMSQLWALSSLSWPDWGQFTVYQPLILTHPTSDYPLGAFDQKGELEFLPGLATDWTVSADSITYTYNLRQGVKFSTGNPFNAYQVWTQMYAWYYLNSNGTNFLGGLDLFDMSNANFGPASLALLKVSGLANPTGQALEMMTNEDWPIYATGPYQIVFRMKYPFLYLNGLLVGFQGLLFDCQWALDNGGFGTPAEFNPYFESHPLPGTGPYAFSDFVYNDNVKFVRNPNYWGANLTPEQISANPFLNPGQAKTVIIYKKADDISRFTDLSTGAAQLVAIKGRNWPLVEADPRYEYAVTGKYGAKITALAFNTQKPPTNNVNLRRAIAHAINYADIWEKAYAGRATSVMGPETPNYGLYYNPGNLPPYEYDLNKARDFLTKAGYPEGKGLPTLEFIYLSGSTHLSIAGEIIQANLAEIGIKAEITEQPPALYYTPYGSYSTTLKNAKDVGHLSFHGGNSYAPDYLAPTNFWIGFVTRASLWGNWAIYDNPVVYEAVQRMLSSSDTEAIVAGLTVAQKQIYDDVPYAWISAPELIFIDGSIVWNRNVVKQVFVDPGNGGINSAPIFNTVVFASNAESSAAGTSYYGLSQTLLFAVPVAFTSLVPKPE